MFCFPLCVLDLSRIDRACIGENHTDFFQWEYPEVDDRSGKSDDYANLSTLLQRVKSALKATGGRDGLSITLPASYCQLFQIVT